MKKKYSTLLNFALATCVATTLVACSDGDYTGGSSKNQKPKLAMLQGFVMDTNGNPISGATAATQGKTAKTDASGMYTFTNLFVTTTTSVDHGGDDGICITVHVDPPDSNHLNAWTDYCPQAEIDGMQDALEDDDLRDGAKTIVNPLVTFVDNYIAEAYPAVLPVLDAVVTGRLENCTTEEAVAGVSVKLDMVGVDPDCDFYGAYCGYSTGQYSATTNANGEFIIDNVPEDSVLRLYVPRYKDVSIESDQNGYDCSVYNDCAEGYAYIGTLDEAGEVFLGDVCVNPITTGDSSRPCVSDIEGWVIPAGLDPDGFGYVSVPTPWSDDTLELAVLHDNIDGTDGIDIIFNESLMAGTLNDNSIVIWDMDDEEYITDFTKSISGSTLTITTTDPIPEGHHILAYLLRDDFRDLAGNFLYAEDLPSNKCNYTRFAEEYYSLNGTGYVVVGFRMHAVDSTNVGEVTDLAQVCLDDGGAAGLADLNAGYPSVFSDQGNSTTTGLFQNLNDDPDYEFRLAALADVIGGASSSLAVMENGYATVTFTEAGTGSWYASASGSAMVTSNDEANPENANGTADSVTVWNAKVGTKVTITSLDDFDNPSNVADITLGDCVAPTTVLNYAYNTCGHLGTDYGGSWEVNVDPDGGYDADNAEHICVENISGVQDEIGDGGENTQEGVPGELGIPTLNITCRLLKDPADMPNVCAPVNFFGLYDGTDIDQSNYYDSSQECNNGGPDQQESRLYDATQWAAWRAGSFPDTIGVAFSESIQASGGNVVWGGTTAVTSWAIGNNIPVTDDGDTPDGGPDADDPDTSVWAPTVDLVQITVADVLTLANVDHGEIMDFSAAVEDTEGNAADNARVIVNDLLPPFVEWAYWNGGLVIQFNEEIAPNLNTDYVNVCDPITLNCSSDIPLTNATLSEGNTRLTIPIADVAGAGVDNAYFPTFDSNDTNTIGALTYDEPIYDALDSTFNGPYDHAILDTNMIPDAHGNTGFINADGNTWDQWYNAFEDVDGDEQCNTPEFAIADVLGPFVIPTQNITNFDTADTTCGPGGPFTHIATYTFSHPLDLATARWPGVVCGGDPCLVTEINNATNGINNQAWVDTNVLIDTGGGFTPIGSFGTSFSGVGASLAADRLSMTITFTNNCYAFQLGDIINPDWTVYSAFGVGTGLNLNPFVVAQ
jgi:hypothetical protein